MPTSLTAIIPVFNGAGWIGQSVAHVDRAVGRARFGHAEIIVVDDGSTDATVAEVEALQTATPLRLLRQGNAGRFRAREAGLEVATGDFVLFVDTRVFLAEGALAYIEEYIDDPNSAVWTADVRLSTEGNYLGRFWRAIEHVAWRRYFRHPRRTSFGLDEFDYFPKGTTAFFCPRVLLLEAYKAFVPTVSDPSKINDDTALLRFVAARFPINIAPEYTCLYHARTTLGSFLRHANHRGSVLIDGYLRPGTRFAVPIAVVLALTPIVVALMILAPLFILAACLAGSVAAGLGAAALGADAQDAAVLGGLAVPFGVAYLLGMWRGFFLKLQQLNRLRGGSA
jgi:glycosyltransferase involved in cell wall biosynthesis